MIRTLTGEPSDLAAAPWSLDRLKAGDPQAWRAAYSELWRIACAILSRRVFSKESVEDLAQETLAAVAAEINTFSDERHIKAVTSVIAARRASHFQRDETAGRRDRRCETTLDAAAEVADAAPAAQIAADLTSLLADLDPLDRSLIEGRYLEKLKSHELAERHQLNANTVRGRLKRTIASLHDRVHAGTSAGLHLLGWIVLLHLLPFSIERGLRSPS